MNRPHRVLALLSLLAAAVLAGCSPTEPNFEHDLPFVEGEWTYTATNIRMSGRPSAARCEIDGVTLEIGPWRPTGFFGRSTGGTMSCTGELDELSGPLPAYPVRRGGSVLHFIAFDIGSPAWRHEGEIAGDTMKGIFRLDHETFMMTGDFLATRIFPFPIPEGSGSSLGASASPD